MFYSLRERLNETARITCLKYREYRINKLCNKWCR